MIHWMLIVAAQLLVTGGQMYRLRGRPPPGTPSSPAPPGAPLPPTPMARPTHGEPRFPALRLRRFPVTVLGGPPKEGLGFRRRRLHRRRCRWQCPPGRRVNRSKQWVWRGWGQLERRGRRLGWSRVVSIVVRCRWTAYVRVKSSRQKFASKTHKLCLPFCSRGSTYYVLRFYCIVLLLLLLLLLLLM